MERDTFLTAEAAKEFGLVDKVIERRLEEALKTNLILRELRVGRQLSSSFPIWCWA